MNSKHLPWERPLAVFKREQRTRADRLHELALAVISAAREGADLLVAERVAAYDAAAAEYAQWLHDAVSELNRHTAAEILTSA